MSIGASPIASAPIAALLAAGEYDLTIAEIASAEDTVSGLATYNLTVAESASATDTYPVTQTGLVWFLSFADVVPPPEGEGPGNPGKLKGDLRYEEI